MEEVMHPSSEVDSDRKRTDAVFMSSVPLTSLTLRPKSGENATPHPQQALQSVLN